MIVLVVGGGGREHALCWKLRQDDPAVILHAAPGNPGIAELATCHAVRATDVEGLAALAQKVGADLTIVGPEASLAEGLVDTFRSRGLHAFGPTRAAAEIETSKSFAKSLMFRAGIPTARAEMHSDAAAAREAALRFGAPLVIKASGLAAGKGVVVAATLDEAHRAIDWMLLDRAFGDSGSEVLVEEFMEGEELSLLVLTDGERAVPLVPAQDHKRLREGDVGPNTGGMGAYAPVSLGWDQAGVGRDVGDHPVVARAMSEVVLPTLRAMREAGRPFTGLLYAGLMITDSGPRVVEFNCRFGDPETQAVLPVSHLEPSFTHCVTAIARGDGLPAGARCTVEGHAVTTVVAAAGYPEQPRTGDELGMPDPSDGVLLFHAGTTRDEAGTLRSSGGRVLTVTGVAGTFAEARARSAAQASAVTLEGMQLRRDIGWREAARNARAP